MKTKITLLFFLLFTQLISAFSQTNYSDYNSSQKQIIISDGFGNEEKEHPDWKTNEPNPSWIKIENGFCTITCDDMEDFKEVFVNQTIDKSKDYEIEISIKMSDKNTVNAFMFDWGSNNGYFEFRFMNENSYSLVYGSSSIQDLIDYTKSQNFTPGAFNKITVRKINDKFYVFINEKFDNQVACQSIDINYFMIKTNTISIVDNIKINYLNPPQNKQVITNEENKNDVNQLNSGDQIIKTYLDAYLEAKNPKTIAHINGKFTDPRDKRVYKTVKIGNQIWMAENLKYKADNSYCADDKPENCEETGRYYNWEASKTVCPTGWHLPTYKEWETLALNVDGYNSYDELSSGTISGFNLKESGERDERGNYYTGTCFWTKNEYNSEKAFIFWCSWDEGIVYLRYEDKKYFLSVRCVKNK